jgi:hypothetical protein
LTRGWQAKPAGVNQHRHRHPHHHIPILIVARPEYLQRHAIHSNPQRQRRTARDLIVARYSLASVNQNRASINKRLPASINIGIIIPAATFST